MVTFLGRLAQLLCWDMSVINSGRAECLDVCPVPTFDLTSWLGRFLRNRHPQRPTPLLVPT